MAVAQDKKASQLTVPVAVADTDFAAGVRPASGGDPNLDIQLPVGLIRAPIIDGLAAGDVPVAASGVVTAGGVPAEVRLEAVPLTAEEYGVQADDDGAGAGTDDTAAFAALLAASSSLNRPILLPPRKIKLTGSSPIRLPTALDMHGTSDKQGVTSLKWYGSGAAMFDSDINNYCSPYNISNMEIVANNTPGVTGTGDCLKLYGVTNNSRFRNLLIRNFKNNAFTIARQTLNAGDPTSCGNVKFDQIFVVSCGGYAFDVDGYPNAVWTMCDFNSCVGGGYRFRTGVSNQAQVTIIGQWWEGTQSWSGTNFMKLDSPTGLVINLIGGTFQNFVAGSNRYLIDNVGATTPVINMIGCARTGFDADYHDGANSVTYSDGDRGIFSAHGAINGAALKAAGTGPTIDLHQTSGGTTDQRRFRASISGNLLVLTSRLDSGTASKTLMTLAHNSGAMNLPNATTLSINSVQALTTRRTGWTAATGTGTKTGFVTSTATTQQVAEALKALIDDLIAHGLIGT